jgi:hypothetical protein
MAKHQNFIITAADRMGGGSVFKRFFASVTCTLPSASGSPTQA